MCGVTGLVFVRKHWIVGGINYIAARAISQLSHGIIMRLLLWVMVLCINV